MRDPVFHSPYSTVSACSANDDGVDAAEADAEEGERHDRDRRDRRGRERDGDAGQDGDRAEHLVDALLADPGDEPRDEQRGGEQPAVCTTVRTM